MSAKSHLRSATTPTLGRRRHHPLRHPLKGSVAAALMDRPSAAGLVATATATAQRSHPTPPVAVPDGSGTGRSLPPYLLIIASLCSLFATLLSLTSIYSHLKNYRKPHLQRFVVRLILIVPIYSTSSAIGLFSLPAAFLIDLIRDLYEAFAIYCFFELLVAYLGGERSVLVLMIGRRPIQHPWPFRIFLREMDMSDPYTFLAIKRGILQYVQIKPILAASTVILKTFGRYEEGELSAGNGYTYVSTVYSERGRRKRELHTLKLITASRSRTS